MLNKKAIQLFRWVSLNIDYNKKRWLKVHPIELNTIYEYRDAFSLPIAIWTEFEDLSDARNTDTKKTDSVPQVFFLEHYNNRIRIGF